MPSQPKPKKVGRPALPEGSAKAVMLRVRITPEELKAVEAAANAQGQRVSEWIRGLVTKAVAE